MPKTISVQERKETIVKKTEKDPINPNKKDEQPNQAAEPAGDDKQEPEKEPEQEDAKPGQEEPEKQDSAQSQEGEPPEKEEPPQAEEPAPAEPSSTATENEQLKADLLEARSQIAAYSAGVAPEMVADAVTLAKAEAAAGGEVTEEAVTKAMENVLKRHPEWKANQTSGAKKTTGGFKLGADPDSAGRSKENPSEKGGSKKPWNKFNR